MTQLGTMPGIYYTFYVAHRFATAIFFRVSMRAIGRHETGNTHAYTLTASTCWVGVLDVDVMKRLPWLRWWWCAYKNEWYVSHIFSSWMALAHGETKCRRAKRVNANSSKMNINTAHSHVLTSSAVCWFPFFRILHERAAWRRRDVCRVCHIVGNTRRQTDACAHVVPTLTHIICSRDESSRNEKTFRLCSGKNEHRWTAIYDLWWEHAANGL